jgi:hypothetical protein
MKTKPAVRKGFPPMAGNQNGFLAIAWQAIL